MIDKVFAVMEATRAALFDDEVLHSAREILDIYEGLDAESMSNILFEYSAQLVSIVASLTTEALLNDEQMRSLLDTVQDISSIEETGF